MDPRTNRRCVLLVCLVIALQVFFMGSVRAEDGYRLWLRYELLPRQTVDGYRSHVRYLVVSGRSATLDAARSELVVGCSGLLGSKIPVADSVDSFGRDGAVVVGTPASSTLIAGLKWQQQLAELGPEGFRIRSLRAGGRRVIVIASSSETGALYGAFHFLRLMQTLQPLANLDVSEKPRLKIRMLDHWDNLDGSVERGYAGASLWDWNALPGNIDPRLRDYARANASLGINGSAINNVNARSQILQADYLRKVAAIADTFRPYGVHVYLSARFSAPIELGGLKTADPLDPEVAAWWKKKLMRSTSSSRILAVFWSRPTARASPGRAPTIAITSTARTCWLPPWRPITVS